MICELMFIRSNHNGIKCLCNLLQLDPCHFMFKEISDIPTHIGMIREIRLLLQIISAMQRKWFEQ